MKGFKQEAVDHATTAVPDRPAVRAAKAAFVEAYATHHEAKGKLSAAEAVLSPPLYTATSQYVEPDAVAVLQARAALSDLRQEFWIAEAHVQTAERQFQKVVEQETRALTLARQEPRRELVRALFGKLDEAKAVAEEIATYDEETTRLGGQAPQHPFSELLGDSHKPSMVDFRREYFLREGTL